LEVDPQGIDEDDNSHYMAPGSPGNPIRRPYLSFGEGGVRDAEDALVILHEYGHAIQDNCNPGFNNPPTGLGEGFGDLLAAIYYDDKHHESKTRGLMFSWDASPFGAGPWPGRRYDINWYFDGPEYTSNIGKHNKGQFWCATIFELYRKLGGDSKSKAIRKPARDLTLRFHLMANFNITTINAEAYQAALEIEAADNNLSGWKYPNGIHRKVIYDLFSRRHLDQFPPQEVDIYIDDGRNGGYRSLSSQDQFTEGLWKEEYWDTQDIWNKNLPYPDDTSKSNGSSADHEGPIVGTETHLYVKIKNKGSNNSGSGKVNVQAYRSIKGKESKFEEDWTPIGTLTVPNVLPGQSNGAVVGSIRYTPEKENEAVMTIVECDSDQSIIKNINTSISCQDFVPFDNNIGMRLV
jgi:zinc metalloprotease ZmpB